MILCTTCGKEIELKQQISSLKSQLAKCIESHDYRQHLIDTLYKQLANIKYLNAGEVEKVLDNGIYFDCIGVTVKRQNIAQAICNLAIPDIDRDKIIEIIQKHTHIDMLAYSHQIDKSRPVPSCFVTTEDFENCVDEIIKAIRGD